MYYDGYKTLTHNALFNFIIGNRGGGKTYWCKKWAINDFLKNGKEFVYVRRYKTELKKISTFFRDISEEFPDHEFAVNGQMFYIDKSLAGYAIALSNAKIEKSVAYPNVNKIIFDEFILDKGTHRYLSDEVTNFLELYETVARMRNDVRVFFLSNAVSSFNPYFMYFDLSMPKGKNVYKKGELLIESVQDSEFIEAKKNTRFGKLIDGTAYGDYAIENKMLRDTNDFVKPKNTPCSPYYNFIFKSQVYGVWLDDKGNYLYVDSKQNNAAYLFATTKDDYTEGSVQPELYRDSVYWSNLCRYLRNGWLYFSDNKAKKATYEMVSRFIRW